MCTYNVKQQGVHKGFQNDAAFHRRLHQHHLRSGDVIGIQGSWGEGLGLQQKGTEKKIRSTHGEGKEMQTLSRNLSILPFFF